MAKDERLHKGRIEALLDPPDIRDRYYEPALLPLPASLDPRRRPLAILDQGREGACTGFGLAAVIHHQKGIGPDAPVSERVSPRMIYDLARRYDEWPGEQYEGSSLRGAIRGWFHNGVCSEARWPYSTSSKGGGLTLDRALDARRTTVGAYYRLRPELPDFHAALVEAGVVYCSAQVHKGWDPPKGKDGRILPDAKAERIGGHAFALVGYDSDGFWVQNSWGPRWGAGGLAHWSYEDWVQDLMDAWVVRLGVSTPRVFHRLPDLRRRLGRESAEAGKSAGVKRFRIAGHFAHVDDGRFVESGKYWSTLADVKETAAFVATGAKGEGIPAAEPYEHLVLYAHGGLNGPDDAAKGIAARKDGFQRNGVYPFDFMWETGLCEELKDLVGRSGAAAAERAGAFTDQTDLLIEKASRKLGGLVWGEMKKDAARLAAKKGAGRDILDAFLDAFAKAGRHVKVHLVGHSAGSILLGHGVDLLKESLGDAFDVASVSLLAPACTSKFFFDHYGLRIQPKGGGLRSVTVYNLTDDRERDDSVGPYRKSLLYLVSNAFEEDKGMPLLGMAAFSKPMEKEKKRPGLAFHYAGEAGAPTSSKSHGGFDNDAATLNSVLTTILGHAPAKPFTKEELAKG